jgi:hypothetical protein
MSNMAVLARPQEEIQETGWIELDDFDDGQSGIDFLAEPDIAFAEMDVPVVSFDSQDDLRFGPRSYTPEQAQVIDLAARQRKPLPADSLPFDE